MTLAVALLWEVAHRWFYAIELYSSEGFLFPAIPNSAIQPFAFDAFTTLVLYSLLVILIGMLLFGWHSRLCAALVFGLLTWFMMLDAATTLTKYNAISLHLLFFLSLAEPGGVWSVDAWWRNRQGRGIPLAFAWPRFLVRLLVASIYLGAAVTKIRLPDFATGDLLEFSLLDDAYGGTSLGLLLATKPRLLILASYATIVFELLFPFLIWVPQLRRTMLFSALAFHLMLAVMMHLETFSLVMFAALCVFLTESDLQLVQNLLSKIRWFSSKHDCVAAIPRISRSPTKHRALNAVLFLLAVGAAVAGFVGYQYQRDFYGVFHENRSVAFPELDTEQAYEMIDAYQPDYRDYFHRIEVGSRLGYRHVYGESQSFQPDQVVYVLARLLKPHPSLDLEWQLIAPKETGDDEPAIASYRRRLDASHSYASIGFRLDREFQSGRYLIRLLASERLGAKEVITEIPFELVRKE